MPAPIMNHHSVILQERDLAVLRGLFESRVMTARHVATLYFEGRAEAAKKRLQKLKAAGLVSERARRANEPSILFLARKAFPVLQEHGILAQYPLFTQTALQNRAKVSEFTLRHELEVADVKAAFHSALAKAETSSIAEFTTWPLLSEFEARLPGLGGREVKVKPDGFLRLHEKEADGGLSEHALFLEVDRSSETLDTLVVRAACYLDHYHSGGFAVKSGATRSDYRDFPFRVLMVFKSAERRNNIASLLLRSTPPVLTMAYLSTLAEVKADPLGAIWMIPRDYRKAVEGTDFDPEKRRNARVYGRQTPRDDFVEQNVLKRQILKDESETNDPV